MSVMPRYLIQRTLGNISEDELATAVEASSRVREEQFPEIEWEHSHVVRTADGLTAYCIYAAPTAQRLREHAAATGFPADDVQEIHRDLQP